MKTPIKVCILIFLLSFSNEAQSTHDGLIQALGNDNGTFADYSIHKSLDESSEFGFRCDLLGNNELCGRRGCAPKVSSVAVTKFETFDRNGDSRAFAAWVFAIARFEICGTFETGVQTATNSLLIQ